MLKQASAGREEACALFQHCSERPLAVVRESTGGPANHSIARVWHKGQAGQDNIKSAPQSLRSARIREATLDEGGAIAEAVEVSPKSGEA